jgi:DNA polymerase elongation subunit (family B)
MAIDYSSLTTNELKELRQTCIKNISKYTNNQMARKIQLNSLFGVLGTPFFRYFRLEIAESITYSGQFTIKWIEKRINKYLNKVLGTDGFDYVIASDTDSVVGETLIYVNGVKKQIKDFYDEYCSIQNLVHKRNVNDYVHYVSNLNLYTKSYENNSVIEDKILHVMKHKVKKKLYKITIDEKEIVVTEDHSLIVERNNDLIEVKPNEVVESDVFITISNSEVYKNIYVNNSIQIECLGEVECEVYDIETEKTNKFFGNDILVHNSIYLNLGPLVDKAFGDKIQSKEKIVNTLDKFCESKIQPFIDSSYEDLADYMNAYEQKMQMKRECIADRGIWTAKKRYILNVWDSEGVRYTDPKLKIMGIEAVKSSTPAPCRKMFKEAFKIIMNGTEEELIEYIDKCRNDFKKLKPEEIAFPRTASDIRKYQSSSTIYSKGTPIHVRGALLFNHYIKQNNLTNKYSLINNGEKIKFIYLKTPNIIRENIISFIQEFPRELNLDKYIDYELQFNTSFLEPIKIILDAIGWKIEKTNSLESFFF